ncbi:GRB2-associated and regulator of MAPK protein 1 isoform X1 [Myxocyprinus asiaticus]|uniref:GRB2-associated and regulator of MAPK protein 1 isoform X1 n=2 Tax=Myxocyprinus asiaticus TaxID=70543 RepID=UPI002221C462|nr:GRB2-associated and regulator of MAPK protein 1 isoform X1 [Myxocyprinus asiaticus]
MDLGLMLYNSLKDVTWSTTTLPLDRLVSAYRLPQIVKLDSGELLEGLRENDYLLIHSCRQWTTITAHSLEEGHYVIGPKIEIPVHYEGQFKLLEQDRDIKEPVQYFNSVEEVAKAFPERVYVMEEITFNVKMASGESNEDTEVYNITLSTGDELTLMGQAEILYAKTSREKSRFNTIFKRIGKLNSISKLGRGKMPCLICMNHRTNESISLPFQCRGRFSTCSPLELQMQEGEHTIRTIAEKTRLPVNVMVPSSPPRNPHDLHLIREGHRYKLVNIQTKTVVVCCALRSNKILPVHFPLHVSTALPCLLVPEGLLQGEAWLETVVHRWFTYCQEQFDIDDYSRAVRDVRVDWIEDSKSPKKSSIVETGSGSMVCNSSGSGSNGCPSHVHLPSSLSSARDELTQSFHRLSVCVYGNNLHGNSEVNLQSCVSLYGDCVPPEPPDADYLFPELLESSSGSLKPDVPYEELWLDHVKNPGLELDHTEGVRGNPTVSSCTTVLAYPTAGPTSALLSADVSLPPPPVPPKSEAVKEECRLLNAPPIPPRSSKQQAGSSSATVPYTPAKPRQTETRSPSPTLSYYSSGLRNIGGEGESPSETDDQNHACYPCNWIKPDASEVSKPVLCLSPSIDASFSRLSWPNDFCGADSYKGEDFPSVHCRSYSSYPRKKTPGTPKVCPSGLFDFDRCVNFEGSTANSKVQQVSQPAQFCTKSTSYTMEMYRDKPTEECNTKQSQSCPILPPRTPKSNDTKKDADPTTAMANVDAMELESKSCSFERPHQSTTDVFSISYPIAAGLSWQPPKNLSGLSIEEVSKSLRFIGLSDDVVTLFVQEKIDGNLLLQLTEEILSEDFKLSKLQVKKLMQFINGWRPKM